jgi:hypothetical protein
MKKCSTCLVVKEIKSKQHMDFISLQLERPWSRVMITTIAGKDEAKLEALYTAGGNAN